jgi:hypothetical protein
MLYCNRVQKIFFGSQDVMLCGEIDPLIIITHRVAMEELAEVYYKFEEEDKMQKVFVQTKLSAPPTPESPNLTRYT